MTVSYSAIRSSQGLYVRTCVVLIVCPAFDISDTHGFRYHIYADDSQLYRSTEVNDVSVVMKSLNESMIDVSSWMSANKLELNEEKTDTIIIDTESKLLNTEIRTVKLNNQELMISSKVRNPGAYIGSNLFI
ncbi:oRF2-encoded protein [Elysia marginata]|uniref:ORF2-encoded protein n=1 Tax=Elysia marginata TaxID=1093978 RepID=A0AAV4FQ36_9GAST|nr:oRF2-encoded protein [Elysia marginata]